MDFIAKIERNANVVDKAPLEMQPKFVANINWARELSSRLDQLDYDQRQVAIENIHRIMDEDYVAMGFELNETSSRTM